MTIQHGARGGTRTHTSLRTLAPEASESTNSTTRASGADLSIGKSYTITTAAFCQYSFSLFSPLRSDFSSARRGIAFFLFCAENTVARIAKTGDNIAVVI